MDNPAVWEMSRLVLDHAFGLYRKRMQFMHDRGMLRDNPSIIDIGCGIGQYSGITKGAYLGVDLNGRYIEYARKRNCRANRSFRCVDVAAVAEERTGFDLVLMVDILHHISDEQCGELLSSVSRIARKYIVSFEPIPPSAHCSIVEQALARCERGKYMRPADELQRLFRQARLVVTETAALRFGPIGSQAIVVDISRCGERPL